MARSRKTLDCPECAALTRKREECLARIAALEAQLAAVKKNSSNSSKPPSSDIVTPPPKTGSGGKNSRKSDGNKRKAGDSRDTRGMSGPRFLRKNSTTLSVSRSGMPLLPRGCGAGR